jgi:hypothetical protein
MKRFLGRKKLQEVRSSNFRLGKVSRMFSILRLDQLSRINSSIICFLNIQYKNKQTEYLNKKCILSSEVKELGAKWSREKERKRERESVCVCVEDLGSSSRSRFFVLKLNLKHCPVRSSLLQNKLEFKIWLKRLKSCEERERECEWDIVIECCCCCCCCCCCLLKFFECLLKQTCTQHKECVFLVTLWTWTNRQRSHHFWWCQRVKKRCVLSHCQPFRQLSLCKLRQ